MPRWPAVVAAARACVGTRFRPQGRVAGRGLDCVGVVLIAAAAAGIAVTAPAYRLGGDLPDVAALLARHGCCPVKPSLPGDVMLFAPASRQRHFGIVTPAGMVQAHAGIGRVVEGPMDPAWTVIGAWRLPGVR
ncbi:peptidoglycan endopeptidase [Polymorphobacter fuscus]|uniref:Peptidoglycan endopeptidase n=2 Tax=Sandarakinorhabdus fusca TaxID=1439888 RepID=A0A7C9GSR2_9SPHN|nr:peptidoglycan endopeptidase [Polymorphobacter fuscus]MQT15689.1 peptidoglycan endopeptidase [Polymorphobacter fuscus]